MEQGSEWTTRLVVGRHPDRSFDIEFWQKQGRNFKELLLLLSDYRVEYLIVGGYAGVVYSRRWPGLGLRFGMMMSMRRPSRRSMWFIRSGFRRASDLEHLGLLGNG